MVAKKKSEFIDETTGELEAVKDATGADSIVVRDEVEEPVVSSATEKKSSKKGEKRWYIVHTYSGYENKVKGNR